MIYFQILTSISKLINHVSVITSKTIEDTFGSLEGLKARFNRKKVSDRAFLVALAKYTKCTGPLTQENTIDEPLLQITEVKGKWAVFLGNYNVIEAQSLLDAIYLDGLLTYALEIEFSPAIKNLFKYLCNHFEHQLKDLL